MTCDNTLKYICADDYRSWAAEGRTDCQGLLDCGLIAPVPQTDSCVSGKAWRTNAHFWSFTDNVAKTATTPKIGADCGDCYEMGMKEMAMNKLMRTQCWTYDNLVDHCNRAGGDPMTALANLWGQWSRDLLNCDAAAILRGVFESELANKDGEGNVYNGDDVTTNQDAGFFGFCAMLEGTRYMGCKRSDLQGVLVHTDVYTNLMKSGQITIETVDCEDGCIERSYLNGKRICETEDECLITDDDKYISVLFREGALAYDPEDLGEEQMGMDKEECSNGGIGSKMWVTREKHILHPIGWSNQWEAPENCFTPSPGDLKSADTWCRVYDRRNTGLAFVCTSEKAPA